MFNKKKNNFYTHDLQLTSDGLAYTSDEDLNKLCDSLYNERDMTVREGYISREVEISICYVQREIDIREKRHISHADYSRNHSSINLVSVVKNEVNESVQLN